MNYLRTLIFPILFILIFQTALSQNIEDYFQLGKTYFNKDEFVKAKNKFSYVVSKNEMYYEAYTYRARCYIALNQNDSVLIDFEMALKRKPDYLPALFYRAKFYKQQKQYSKALKDLDVVIKSKPDYIPAILERAEIYKLQNKEVLAFNDYTNAINNGTKNPEVYFWRSVYYYDNKDFNKSLADIDKAISLQNNVDRYHYQKAIILQSLGRKNLAITEYSKCISLNAEYQQAYERRAFLLQQNGDYAKAIDDNDFLIGHFHLREDSIPLNNGNMEIKLKDWTAADRYFMKATSINPKNDDALMGRAKVSIAKDKASSAVNYLKRVLRNNPKNAEAYFILGNIYYDQKNLELALENFSSSLKIEESAEVLCYRASVYYQMKEASKACYDIRKSRELGFARAAELEKLFCR